MMYKAVESVELSFLWSADVVVTGVPPGICVVDVN